MEKHTGWIMALVCILLLGILIGAHIERRVSRYVVCSENGYDGAEIIDGVVYCYVGDPPSREYFPLNDLVQDYVDGW